MQALKLLIVALCVISLAFAEQAPVFLWGANSEAKPSLPTVHEKEFAELVTPILADKTLIVFLENGLTNKDFLCTDANDGKSCFARLQGISGKTFLASVENPVEALRSIECQHEYVSVDATGKFSNPLEVSKPKIVFVNFDVDAQSDNSRGDILKKHDSAMDSVTSQFGDAVFYMYTSAPSTSVSKSLKRQRRETAASVVGNVFPHGADLLLYYTTLTVVTKDVTTQLEVTKMEVDKKNESALAVTMVTKDLPLTFDITLFGGYFFMTNVVYNKIKFISTEVYAPTDFSYFCGNLTLNSYITEDQPTPYSIQWNSFQFQAPFGSVKNESFVFGDAWHCVGFFTGGILSGLLIVALLLTITFIGVCWMMDINTMDRFDDPKGKTITINASD